MITSREIRLKSRPSGALGPEHFELATVEVPPPSAGDVQVRNLWMSVDPYMRPRMNDVKSYVPPYEVGKPLDGGAIGEVIASADPAFAPGDLVESGFGWREVFNAPAKTLRKLDPQGLPPQVFLGVAGMPGFTAYVGLLKIAALTEGDVVFVSAAAGAVGQVVCQIAKARGHKVIGSAGGPEKAAWLKEIGVDEVIDYKAVSSIREALARAAPEGIDVYFDNVGGAHLEAALALSKNFARFALCGAISEYNSADRSNGVRNLFVAIQRRLRLQGFIILDHFDQLPQFRRDMRDWIVAGRMKWRETVETGIENAPAALMKLFTGGNVGKMLVKLA
ncbi:MAG TPA: NADP-dependent oxidoreductase [Steroidobacteraceae bacterium]|jgi:NADPH-dependent curcumin reductase CurA|nr:NADP-dependent oxidoreductase [Steroidobacteraceae bacterium]